MNTEIEREIERELWAYWTQVGIPVERQDEILADCAKKAQPGAMVGPFIIPE